MLERIRDGIQGPWAMAIVALIVVSFVFTGVGGYLSSSASTAAAVVNDKEIAASSLDLAYQNERARMESQFGDAISSLFANETYLADFRKSVLDRLINDELIAQKAAELGLRVSDEQIRQTIVQLPEFQLGGQFNNDVYSTALARAGYTPSSFAEYMRTQMTRQQLVQALNGSTFDVGALVANTLKVQEQTRDVSVLEVSADTYLDEVTLTDEEIQAYYNENIDRYDTQEQVKLAYVSLSLDDLKPRVSVTDEEVANQYEEQKGFYRTPESRSVSHILIEIEDDEDAARSEAQTVIDELNAGQEFAQLAEQYSDDIVSAEIGGSLGEVNPGDYPEDFEEAVFALTQEGQISGIVETEFGFHIIKLDELTESVTTPFEDVKDEIRDDLILSKATDLFFELQGQMERLAFEVPDTLEEVALAVDRPVFETVFFSENRYPSAVNYPQIENVAFSSELIDDAVNSELLQVSDEKVMVVRMADYKPQRTKSLDEVKTEIETALKAEKAQQNALAWAQNLQTKLFSGEDVSAMLDEKSLSWRDIEALARTSNQAAPSIVEAAFKLSPDPANNSSVVTLNNGNVGIVKLNAVNQADLPDEDALASAQQQMMGQYAQRTYQNFIEALRANAEIEIIN
uniref:SurA N-terminal domain-containing protein n=1 Tax=Ningiella ruwaisensis TaxID=2364274 RepID=UPI00109FBF5E|nr:SurA N-terminal domain-containing protein [Ningiella ruwaisensis]